MSKGPKSKKISLKNQNSNNLDKTPTESENPDLKDVNSKSKALKNLGKAHLMSTDLESDKSAASGPQDLGNLSLKTADKSTNVSSNNPERPSLQSECHWQEANIDTERKVVANNSTKNELFGSRFWPLSPQPEGKVVANNSTENELFGSRFLASF